MLKSPMTSNQPLVKRDLGSGYKIEIEYKFETRRVSYKRRCFMEDTSWQLWAILLYNTEKSNTQYPQIGH